MGWRLAEAVFLVEYSSRTSEGTPDDGDAGEAAARVVSCTFARGLGRRVCSHHRSSKNSRSLTAEMQAEAQRADQAVEDSLRMRVPLFCFPVPPHKHHSGRARSRSRTSDSSRGGDVQGARFPQNASDKQASGFGVSGGSGKKRFTNEKQQQFRFVLTEEDGTRLHGFCRHVSHYNIRLQRDAAGAATVVETDRSGEVDSTADDFVLCVVSALEWAPLWWRALQFLEKRLFAGGGPRSKELGEAALHSLARGLCSTRSSRSFPSRGGQIVVRCAPASDLGESRITSVTGSSRGHGPARPAVAVDDLLGLSVNLPSSTSTASEEGRAADFSASLDANDQSSLLLGAPSSSPDSRAGNDPMVAEEFLSSLPAEYQLQRPTDDQLRQDMTLQQLIDLPSDDFLAIFTALVLERRIIMASKSVSKLSNAVVSLLQCLPVSRGFKWQHIFIPVLPNSLLDFAMAPVPFVIGVHTSALGQLRTLALERVLFVHLDEGYANVNAFEDLVKLLPERKMLEKAVTDAKLSAFKDTQSVLEAIATWHSAVFGHCEQLVRSGQTQSGDFIRGGKFFHRKFLTEFTDTQMFQQWHAAAASKRPGHPVSPATPSWASPSRLKDAFQHLKGSLASLTLHDESGDGMGLEGHVNKSTVPNVAPDSSLTATVSDNNLFIETTHEQPRQSPEREIVAEPVLNDPKKLLPDVAEDPFTAVVLENNLIDLSSAVEEGKEKEAEVQEEMSLIDL